MAKPLIYTGADQYQPPEEQWEPLRIFPYMPAGDLRDAVNLAIFLERPLLIKGEPGSGKTRLAEAVAYEFAQKYGRVGPQPDDDPEDLRLGWPLYFWSVKSTSQAQDGLYLYDAVGRLRDVQMKIKQPISHYIHYGALGKAFRRTDVRPIVLIDEIDKADIDFPNDLLIEIEDRHFTVTEMDHEEIEATQKPIIFITSNDEKALPDAFLRRCLFFYISFPEPEQLQEIINRRFPQRNKTLVNRAITQFLTLRDEMVEEKGRAGKKVSTSELIDWVKALHRNLAVDGNGPAGWEELSREKRMALFEQAEPDEKLMLDQVLALLDGELPFLSVLLKDWDDYEAYLRRLEVKANQRE